MDPDERGNKAAVASGGAVEPANKAPVAMENFQRPDDLPPERYELLDPFAEVTYRSNTFADMAARADRQGSNKFVAISADGKQSTIKKSDGTWHREAPLVSPADRIEPPASVEQRSPEPKVVGLASPNVRPEAAAARAVAEIDREADRRARTDRLVADLADRYLIKRAPVKLGRTPVGSTEYRFRGDTSRVAFTESTFRLATDTNSPSVARSMVDLAETRDWRALRVSGNEEFKRLIWLEASARGVKALGYEPNPADLLTLQKERDARLINRIKPERPDAKGSAARVKGSARGSGGRRAVLAAIDAVLMAKQVPEKHREAVMAAAAENLTQRVRRGESVRVRVYDTSAPSQRPIPTPSPDQQRSRDRAPPTR